MWLPPSRARVRRASNLRRGMLAGRVGREKYWSQQRKTAMSAPVEGTGHAPVGVGFGL